MIRFRLATLSEASEPGAVINYIFLNEQFVYGQGGFSLVSNPTGLRTDAEHLSELQNLVARKNGYVYIYCSNGSQVEVFFDNLQSFGLLRKRIKIMSVEQTKIIDFIGVDKESGQVILSISDHLEWESNDEHLFLLQEKINSYLSFIESGEINEIYPDALNRHAVIRVYAMHKPNKKGLIFLAEVKKIVERAGLGFEFQARYRC